MNLIQAQNESLCLARAGNPSLLVSGSGLGKSSIVLDSFRRLRDEGAKQGIRWGFGQIFAATQTPPDLIGYQFKGERTFDVNGEQVTVTVTDPSVPLWMISAPVDEDKGGKPAFMYDRFFLCIDEYGQGEADTKRAMAEIFLNGGTSPWYLPQGSVRMACSNEGARYGVGKDFDFAIARRFLLRIEGNVGILVDYMDKPYKFQGREWITTPFTKAWVQMQQGGLHVFEKEPEEQGPWCNPRQLLAVDRYVQCKTELLGGPIDVEDPVTVDTIAGGIGYPAANAYIGDMKVATTLPPFKQVVDDPEGCPVPSRADLMLLMTYQIAAHCSAETLPQCVTYMKRDRVPADMSITFVTSLLRRDYRGIINHPVMKQWVKENGALVSIVTSLSQR